MTVETCVCCFEEVSDITLVCSQGHFVCGECANWGRQFDHGEAGGEEVDAVFGGGLDADAPVTRRAFPSP